MASWLKVAEDLFEVVDRRAKLVAREFEDDHFEFPLGAPVTRGDAQTLREPMKEKVILKRRKAFLTSWDQRWSPLTSKVESVHPGKEDPTSDNFIIESGQLPRSKYNFETYIPISTTPTTSVNGCRESIMEASKNEENVYENSSYIVSPTAITNIPTGTLNTSKEPILPSLPLNVENIQSANGNLHIDDAAKFTFTGGESIPMAEGEKPEHNAMETKTDYVEGKIALEITEQPAPEKTVDHKEKPSAGKVQDQLDEAQGLLKTAISTGQSKEARLARVCAGLSSRLQEYKSENKQLEELLISERKQRSLSEARSQQIEMDLSVSSARLSKVETAMADALSSKNAEIEGLLSTVDVLKKQVTTSEERLGTLQANMETTVRSHKLTEARVIQALREELSAAECRADEERAAHNATKLAFMEREVELERRVMESSAALSRLQRIADERTAKALELDNKISMLEVECTSLNQELQEVEARARRGQKRLPEEANKAVQAWQEEAERARKSQREAESKLSLLEAELQKMRVEIAGMKKDADHYSRQANMETTVRSHKLTEARVIQALREELSAAECRADEERAAHNATKLAFMEREVELERRVMEPSAALSRLQRIADERTAKALELDNKISMLEVECTSLNQELQEVEARARRGQKRLPEEANKAVQAWQEEAERARKSQREAESKLSLLEAELQKMRVEIAGMKKDADHYSRQLQKAAKFLDSGAAHATKFLWRYPVARIIFLFYLVFAHLFLLYLLHRLQYQADDLLSSNEVADSLGLVKLDLP